MARDPRFNKKAIAGSVRAKKGQLRADAVIRGAVEEAFPESIAVRYAGNPIATETDVKTMLTAIMWGEYHRFPMLAGITPGSKLGGMLKAAELLIKIFQNGDEPTEARRKRDMYERLVLKVMAEHHLSRDGAIERIMQYEPDLRSILVQ